MRDCSYLSGLSLINLMFLTFLKYYFFLDSSGVNYLGSPFSLALVGLLLLESNSAYLSWVVGDICTGEAGALG